MFKRNSSARTVRPFPSKNTSHFGHNYIFLLSGGTTALWPQNGKNILAHHVCVGGGGGCSISHFSKSQIFDLKRGGNILGGHNVLPFSPVIFLGATRFLSHQKCQILTLNVVGIFVLTKIFYHFHLQSLWELLDSALRKTPAKNS